MDSISDASIAYTKWIDSSIVFWDETLAIKLVFHDEIADAEREILDKKMWDILVLDNRRALCPLDGSEFDLVFSTLACKYFNISLE